MHIQEMITSMINFWVIYWSMFIFILYSNHNWRFTK